MKEMEPFLKYYWDIVNPTLPEVGQGDQAFALPSYFVRSIDLPIPKFNPEPVFAGGQNKFYAGNMDIDQFSMVFSENYKKDVITYILTWMRHIKNDSGIFSLPQGKNGYKKDIVVALLGPKGEGTKTVMLEGIWPVSSDNLSLGMEGEVVHLTVQFAVDRVYWNE